MANMFEVLVIGGHKYLEGGKEVFADLSRIWQMSWRDAWSEFLKADYRVHTSLILVTTAVVGFLVMIVMANLFGSESNPAKPREQGGVVKRPGDPEHPPPTEVVSLRVYPIKSCRGFEVSSTRLRKAGLTLDRNWMFISKEDGKFMTIRSDASMTLIDTAVSVDEKTKEQMLEISIHNTDARVVIPAFPSKQWLESNTKLREVNIWEKDTDGYEYSEEINKIFSKYFNKPCALIYKGPTSRNTAVNGSEELYGRATAHHFADVMSLQVASEASIKDLNRRLHDKTKGDIDELTIERFRPNIIVRGRDDKPWEEDTWKRIRLVTTLHEEEAIYNIDLDVVARCARCQVPNVNPDTAEKHAKEPWDELMKYISSPVLWTSVYFADLSVLAGSEEWTPAARRSTSLASVCSVSPRTRVRSRLGLCWRSWRRQTSTSSKSESSRSFKGQGKGVARWYGRTARAGVTKWSCI